MKRLEKIKQEGLYRTLRNNEQEGAYIYLSADKPMLNLSSNDYLGLASDKKLQEEFYQEIAARSNALRLSASSSRLLTGNFSIYDKVEGLLQSLYNRKGALIFNSGYHANTGILPAIAESADLILADKLVHASIIDGLKLASADSFRYRHNDMGHLRKLIQDKKDKYNRIFIVTESLFSMDGDEADLKALVALKEEYPQIMIYLDEAHAVGVRGNTGLGICEEEGLIQEIDFIVGTFGKALAGVGAYVICSSEHKELLINTMRTLIFTTGLPPVNLHWSYFILKRLASFSKERAQLSAIIDLLKSDPAFRNCESRSHIMPYFIGNSEEAMIRSMELQEQGFFALAVRPPTVPKDTARLRLSLRSDIPVSELKRFLEILSPKKHEANFDK
ncbi:MAG: aminotransferase class I/II-fold pyridoxal phosphate-dependent enzyme [Bacteroidales bacterium]